jgi:hypothetical protein
MVKSINIQTKQEHKIQIEAVGENKMYLLDQPSAPAKRIRGILRAIFSALVGCMITSGWSVTVSED